MKIRIYHRPPKLYWIVKLFFPFYDFSETTAFTFGNRIYTHYSSLADYHLEHEKVHARQMRGFKLWAVFHFLRYWASKKFRKETESEAYRTEYQYIRRKYGDKDGHYLEGLSEALAKSVPIPREESVAILLAP